MCPAAPPPVLSSEPVNEPAVHRAVDAGAEDVGVIAEGLGVALGTADGVAAVLLAAAVALALALAAEGEGDGGEACGPHAANDAPKPIIAATASARLVRNRRLWVRCTEVMPLLLRPRGPESNGPAVQPRP